MSISDYVDHEDMDREFLNGGDDDDECEEPNLTDLTDENLETEQANAEKSGNSVPKPAKPKAKKDTAKQPPKPRFRYTPNTIYLIDPKEIRLEGEGKQDPLYDRRIESKEGVEELAAGMLAEGFTSTVTVVEREDIGKPGQTYLQIVAGRRRIEAARLAKLKEVKALVIASDLPDYEYIARMLRENQLRREDTPVNIAEKCRRLIESYVEQFRPHSAVKSPSEGELAAIENWEPTAAQLKEARKFAASSIGVTEKRILQYQHLLEMAPEVVKAVARGVVSEAVVRDWQGDTHEKQAEKLAKLKAAASGRAVSDGSGGKKATPKDARRSGVNTNPSTPLSREQQIEIVSQPGVPKAVRDWVFYAVAREIPEKEAYQLMPWLKRVHDAMDEANLLEAEAAALAGTAGKGKGK